MKRENKNKLNNIKNNIKEFISNFKFKSFNLSFSKQLVLFGSLIGIISLFLPWIINNELSNNWNSFNSISGNIGFLLIIIYLISIFIILSTNYKEKLKLYSDISLKNYFIILNSGIFIILVTIISISFINGLHTFFENTMYGKGVILCMTSGFIISIGGLLLRKEYKLDTSEIILNRLNKNREDNKNKDNMELPF